MGSLGCIRLLYEASIRYIDLLFCKAPITVTTHLKMSWTKTRESKDPAAERCPKSVRLGKAIT